MLVLAVFVYGGMMRHLIRQRGKVLVGRLRLPDLMFVVVLTTWFLALAANGFRQGPREVTGLDIVFGSVVYLVILSVILFSLRARHIQVWRFFGLHRVRFRKALGLAVGLLLAGYPLVVLAFVIAQAALGIEAQRQEIVEYFIGVSNNADLLSIAMTLFLGIVLAPVAEELIFRGYIYGVFKRYLGMWLALLLNAALFAVVHLNLASLPALFVLAACFTIAYEITGSLLVNIFMHSLFNLVSFAAILGHADQLK